MHNTFITRHFDWKLEGGSRNVRFANAALRRLGKRARVRAPGSTGYMTNLELRMNVYHLVSQVLAYGVPGDVLEVGTFTGQTAALMTMVIRGEASEARRVHVYDAFEPHWDVSDPLAVLKGNFESLSLPWPEIHAGWFSQTMPAGLPDQIALAHIDCGFGGDPEQHAAVIGHVLTHLYPRMSPGAICSLVDYTDLDQVQGAMNENPGVKLGVDRFLADKPEKPSVLYAAEYGHAYFRKLPTALSHAASEGLGHELSDAERSEPARAAGLRPR